jgi:RNA polymerase sigma-70 factor, ECF subfamily
MLMSTQTADVLPAASGNPPADPPSIEAQALSYSETLYRTALRLTGHPQDAEDLVQETFLRALRCLAQFSPGTNLRAWLVRILTNSHLDNCRAAARAPRLVSLEGESPERPSLPPGALADRRVSVEEQVLAAFDSQHLREVVAALPNQFGRAVYLADLEERSYDEVARLTGVGRNTVGSRVFRGRALLRERLVSLREFEHWRPISVAS